MPILRLKLVAYVLVVAVLASVASMRVALGGHYAAACEQATQANQEKVRNLARTLSPGLGAEDAVVVAAVARDWLRREPGWLQVTVLDEQGKELLREPAAARTDPQTPGGRQPGTLAGWRGLDPLLRRVFPAPVMEAPIESAGAGRIGVARVRLSAGERGAAVVGMVRAWLTALAVILVVVAAATFVGTGWVVAPLRRIREAASGPAAAGEPAQGPPRGMRELAALARSVDDLASRLSEADSKLRRLSAESAFISDVVQSMADTLIVVDQQAKIRAVNRAAAALLGYSEQELVGRAASLVCMIDGKHLTAETLRTLLEEGTTRGHEVTYFAKDGRRIPISLSGSAIRDAQGRGTGYVCIGADLSNRIAAEEGREQPDEKFLRCSREAAMAEVATGVLHNVGNVLNSVNVSAATVEQMLRGSRVSQVRQLAELLGEHASDLGEFLTADERGRMVPEYLSRLSEHLAREQERALEELSWLNRHLGHIKDIISVQQSIARTARVIEPVDLRELVDDALRVVGESLRRDGVRVERDLADVGLVETDRHKVLQILVNLLNNARDAVKEQPGREGVVAVRLAAGAVQGGAGGARGSRVRLEVEDNGVGIDEEHLTRVFTYGFTTKTEGHGFGLHASALLARELGGSLTAWSEGSGKGARFVLELPVKAAAAEVQAR